MKEEKDQREDHDKEDEENDGDEGKSKVKLSEIALLEPVKTTTSFRHSIDFYNFYRFVSDNDLRREAKKVLDLLCSRFSQMKKKRRGRAKKIERENAKKNK